MQVIERIKNRLYEDKLIEIYSQKPAIMDVLKAAFAQEEHFKKGANLNSDTVLIKAASDDVTGLWEVCIEVDHGTVVYTCLDQEGNEINLYSLPSEKYIKDKEGMTQTEIRSIQIAASNSININLRDTRSLKIAKELFQNDYVLKNIPLYHLDSENAARFLIWHIRAYRKVFLDYYKTFNFLWEGTRFKNASSIVRYMTKNKLVDPRFFEQGE